MKSFYSAEDIEDLAARGQSELIIDENTILTDLARHTADMLGISITDKSQGPSSTVLRSLNAPAGSKVNPFAVKPKGCQSRPRATSQPESLTARKPSKQVVDQLVDAVKRINKT